MDKKIIFLLLIVFISQASALLNDSLSSLSERECALIDYKKVDTGLLKNSFLLNERLTNYDCAVLVDYLPFEDFTNSNFTIALGGLYGIITSYSVLDNSNNIVDYILILGKNESVSEELIYLTSNFDKNKEIFEQSMAVFTSYQEVVQFNYDAKTLSLDICGENTLINYSVSSSVSGTNSSCVDERTLFYPYCLNNSIKLNVVNCAGGCLSGVCVINISSINSTNNKVNESSESTANGGGSSSGGGGSGGNKGSLINNDNREISDTNSGDINLDDSLFEDDGDVENKNENLNNLNFIEKLIEWLKNLFR